MSMSAAGLPAGGIAMQRGDRQSGFTLLELVVAMAIALFLLAGLGTIMQSNRRTYGNQTALAQLQDNQRLAMTMLNDVVRQAGYFPDPTSNTAASTLLAGTLGSGTPVTGSVQNTQSVAGAYQSANPGDAISVRYSTVLGDGILLCDGTSSTVAAVTTYVNTFSVDSSGQLVCQVGKALAAAGTARPLVSGIRRLGILYGVKRNFSSSDNNVDTYVRADQMTTADWLNVSSVKITIVFINPLATTASGASVPGQPATITFLRIVAIMNRMGVLT
jgi:type IV pilus assembly protein PilW